MTGETRKLLSVLALRLSAWLWPKDGHPATTAVLLGVAGLADAMARSPIGRDA